MIERNLRGIDVSTYQGSIDWRAVAADGIRFAMIKATQGRSVSNSALRNFTDSRFAENVRGAAAAGMACGAYHYLTAQSEAEAVQEAEVFLSAIAPFSKQLTLGAAVDVEDSRLPRNRVLLTAIVRAFCDRVKRGGFDIMVYTNPDHLQNRMNNLTEYGLWLALWRDKELQPDPARYPNLRIWQWGTEKIAGISGKSDSNYGIVGLLDTPSRPIDYAAEVKRRAGLAEVTMQYLRTYRYADDRLRKLYEAMTKGEGK